MMRLPNPAAVLCVLACLLLPASGQAAKSFRYTSRIELQAIDPATGKPLPHDRERGPDGETPVLGTTGTIGISRRTVWVNEDGQLFAQARLPQSMASRPHELDLYVGDAQGMSLRGTLRYTPGRGLLVSRTFLFPDLPVGPAQIEIRARGAHGNEWQEIVTQPVEVPKGSRVHFTYALRGSREQNTPMDLVIEARDEDDPSRPARQLYARRVTPGAGRTDWKEASEKLSDLEGRRVRLAFRSRPSEASETAATGVVWGAAAVERDEQRRTYPIILVVSLDSLRTSSVGLYAGGDATPAIDGFFDDGVTMMQAVTQSVTTLPAHATLMTGLTPSAHGVIDETRAISPDLVTLAEALQSEGWTTAAFTDGGALAAELGFGRGFHVFDEGSADHVSPENADALERARKWLDRHSEHPAFVFVHTYRTRPVHTGADARVESVHRRELAAMVEQVRSADAAVGKLLATLDGRTIDDESLYVLTSGHGEEFFEHGAAGHGTHLYEETMRVPLLMRGRKLARRRPEASVGLLDLAPTILDLVEAPVPRSMQGMSFSRIVRGQKATVAVPLFCEARRPLRLLADGTLQEWGGPAFAVRENDLKLIVDGEGRSMRAYDLARDPREQRDLFASGIGPDWARRLAREIAEYRELGQREGARVPAAALTEANRRRLQSLGYLQ